jgi:hypothetical protein
LLTSQLIYGIIAAFSAVLFIIFAREHPPPCRSCREQVHALMRWHHHALKSNQIFDVSGDLIHRLGIFNGVTTWVESIIRIRVALPH